MPEDGRYHLSTFMMPQHRRFVLSEIRKRLSEKQTCRVVSTSLIEAGVDVDFPAVLREITGLDSVLQAAGRCNREGKMNAENCRVTIFEFDKKSSKLFSQNIHAYKYASKKYTEIDKNDAIDLYFRELYSVKGDSSLDEKGIIELTRIGAFADIAEHFHLIEGQNKNVIIPTVENESLVNSLREGMKSRELFQKLGLYTVALFEDDFKSLYSCGAIELVSDDIGILSDLSMYSEKTGLSTNYIGGQALWI